MLENLGQDSWSVDFVERLAANVSTQSPTRFEPRSFENSVLNCIIYDQSRFINICFQGNEIKLKRIEPCWVRREGFMAFNDLRTVERTTRFCLKMESSSSWLLLVVLMATVVDNLETGRVEILGKKKKIDDDDDLSSVAVGIQKTRAPIISLQKLCWNLQKPTLEIYCN